MPKSHLFKTPPHSWQAGWKDNERDQLRFWLKATPAQRLAWLEEAIELAHRAGALDAKKHDP